MRFFQAMFLGVILLSNAEGKGGFHIKGPYDIDNDGFKECLIFNSKNHSILFLETVSTNEIDTLWSYAPNKNISFADGALVDIDKDGLSDLILIPSVVGYFADNPWLYFFKGKDSGFVDKPLFYTDSPFALETAIPANITVLNDENTPLGVCFSSPIRKGLLFNIKVTNNKLDLINTKSLSSSNTGNGYGVLQMSSFSSDGRNFIAMLSAEKDVFNTVIFDKDNDYKILHSKIITVDNAQSILSTSMMPFNSIYKGKNGLLIPLRSDDVYLLNIIENNVFMSTTNISKKGSFPLTEIDNVLSVLETREKAVSLISNPASSNIVYSKSDDNKSPFTNSNLNEELSKLKMSAFRDNRELTSIPKTQQKLFSELSIDKIKKHDYKMLSPTLGDFLTDIKKDEEQSIIKEKKALVPIINTDMESVSWADEAGFTHMNLGEYVAEKSDTISINPIPEINEEIINFTDNAKEVLNQSVDKQDSILISKESDVIDLYYILVMTPASQTRDRYVFDGEAPFGVAVNQIPPTGRPTHFQHGISANTANLSPGETYDFSYTLRDGIIDSITTLTMVHDIQTNVVLMSISPTNDSISQSYQPESFDPKLFEFPKYFFEGFPTSLDMDFTDKLIRFSFDGVEDSIYQGIYLSATTPSYPPQSLAVFMDKGTIQSIKGEVVVRANGSKKITTQFDLTGRVEPELMFSKLIQESFPEDLKVKLLQGASLEEPLFGPRGKLPKVIREPRLPEVQSALPQKEIPIRPKQSNVPIDGLKKIKLNSEIFNINEQNLTNETEPLDSLKLEHNKNVEGKNNDGILPKEEENQIEPLDSLKLEHNKNMKDNSSLLKINNNQSELNSLEESND
ncbi:MAG: hypothetical protein CMG55_01065 [Candidatus Marinimicrobia bacterium]|nr:hypothetical protein [Candidatus Neomarinimicrobiota bacterium]